MLRWAVENGFDQVAWTTGVQQAERYDLSKYIENVEVNKLTRGFDVRAWNDSDDRIIERTVGSEQELAGLIGKELAERSVRELSPKQVPEGWGALPPKEQVRFSGLDLKVGGEGMKAFYDAMLPSSVNKYAKKWGAAMRVVNAIPCRVRGAAGPGDVRGSSCHLTPLRIRRRRRCPLKPARSA